MNNWYFKTEESIRGPFTLDDLISLYKSSEIADSTNVWQEGEEAQAKPYSQVIMGKNAIADPYHASQVNSASYNNQNYNQLPYSGCAIASLVCGIISLMGCMYTGWIGIAAIICGHIAMSQMKKTPLNGKGLAIAGLITGYIGILLTLILVIIMGFIFAGVVQQNF